LDKEAIITVVHSLFEEPILFSKVLKQFGCAMNDFKNAKAIKSGRKKRILLSH